MQEKEKKHYSFPEDQGNEVVFDQPLYYEYPLPKGGKRDKYYFTYYPNGDKGEFFNNLGFDRYGGRYNDNFQKYFRVDPKQIKDMDLMEPPPRKEVKAQLLYSFPEDMDNEVIFDQPYKYHFLPKEGELDDNDFLNFENGDDGFYFNNIGFDRYGGRLDEQGHYFRVNPAKIKDLDLVEDPPTWDPREEDESQWKEKGFVDKNSTLFEMKYRGEEEDEYEGAEPGEEMFVKQSRYKKKGGKEEKKKEKKAPTAPKTQVAIVGKGGTKKTVKDSDKAKGDQKISDWGEDL